MSPSLQPAARYAQCLFGVKLRKTPYEQMFSAVAAKADIAQGIWKANLFDDAGVLPGLGDRLG
jgi:hypothetical protein